MKHLPPEAWANDDEVPEQQEWPETADVLIHFNKHIYPGIEQKYHPEKGKTTKRLLWVLTLLPSWMWWKSSGTSVSIPPEPSSDEERSYERLGMETAKGITDFILWDEPHSKERVQTLLEAMRLDMMHIAYINVSLRYERAAERYQSKGHTLKAAIIKKCLDICDKKFWNSVVTLTFTDDFVIVNGKEKKTLYPKDDFLKGEE